MEDIRECDTFSSSLNSDEPKTMADIYVKCLKKFIMLTSRGSTYTNKQKITYLDVNNPVLRFQLTVYMTRIHDQKDDEKRVTVDFAVQRMNLYFFTYFVDGGRNWVSCSNADIKLKGSYVENISVSYQRCDSTKQNTTGFSLLLTTLKNFHHGDTKEKVTALHTMALHFSEAVRFRAIARTIRDFFERR
jgi:hypothetical protein